MKSFNESNLKSITIPYLSHTGKSGKELINHLIASVNGSPFYKSSGQNSHMANTWFPFLGINTQRAVKSNFRRGWYIKREGFINIRGFEMFNISPRFGNLPSLLISAWIGGGYWDTDEGKQLREKLEKNYPDFNWAQKPEFLRPQANLKDDETSPEIVNYWLTQHLMNSDRDNKRELSLLELKDLVHVKPNNYLVAPVDINQTIEIYLSNLEDDIKIIKGMFADGRLSLSGSEHFTKVLKASLENLAANCEHTPGVNKLMDDVKKMLENFVRKARDAAFVPKPRFSVRDLFKDTDDDDAQAAVAKHKQPADDNFVNLEDPDPIMVMNPLFARNQVMDRRSLTQQKPEKVVKKMGLVREYANMFENLANKSAQAPVKPVKIALPK